jgi:pilus assembly protein CpaB
VRSSDVGTLLREVSRVTRRHRALLSAGLAAAAVAVALPTLAPTPPPTVRIVAAAHDLVSGSPLTAGDLALVAWPRSVAPAGALLTMSDAVGRVLTGPVRTGEALTDVRLVGAALLTPGGKLVAAPVRLADPATAGLLHAGDRVDVLAVRTDQPSLAAVTVASGLTVLAVPAPGSSDPDGALVVLGATPAIAARLAAAAVGSRLSVTLLAP